MDADALWPLLAELVLVMILAILSAAEAAILATRRPQLIEQLAGRGRRGKRAGSIGERSARYRSAIQLSEFIVIFAFAAIAAAFIAPRLSQLLAFFFRVEGEISGPTAVVVTVATLSLIAVLFGLFVPRAIGAYHAQAVLLVLVWPIEAVTWITRPLVALLLVLTRLLTRPFGIRSGPSALVSEDEIRSLVETGEAQGVLEEAERDMIQSIFDLGDKQVHEVMVPRTDIVAIDVATPPEEVLDKVVATGHSRIPVYEGSSDQIVGVLYVKDLFRRLARGERDVALRPYLRPAQFVPETKKVDELLREMQRDKVHIAIVIDEYGGTAGLVTIEDLVEEIVGEIRDEYDVEQELVLAVSDREALMDGRVPFEDVRETFGLDVEQSEDYDTLGGFIVHRLGRLPKVGEAVEAAHVRFVVESVEGRRIRRVRAIAATPSPERV
ncbi:MAG: hemolysin family protein [Candidatus Limnocylindria bacterium]